MRTVAAWTGQMTAAMIGRTGSSAQLTLARGAGTVGGSRHLRLHLRTPRITVSSVRGAPAWARPELGWRTIIRVRQLFSRCGAVLRTNRIFGVTELLALVPR